MDKTNLSQKWEKIIVEPSRLQCGLWGFDEGDISNSYSADVYAEKKTIRQPFRHASRTYVAMSLHGRANFLEARAYPLLHESYRKSILDELENKGSENRYYVGEPVSFRRQKCVLGLPVIFEQRAYTNEEKIDLLRRMYAYGGWFATQVDSYSQYLMKEADERGDTPELYAQEIVFAQEKGLVTQQNLRDFVEYNVSNFVQEQFILL